MPSENKSIEPRRIYYGPRDRSHRLVLPIYLTKLEIVLTHSIRQAMEQPARKKRLGNFGLVGNDCAGLFVNFGNEMALFLDRKDLSHSLVAHEVFHATHRILEFNNIELDSDHHETHANLCGYLTEMVYDDLKRWGARVE